MLDKFLILMEINNVEPIICITKSDLVDEEELNQIENRIDLIEKFRQDLREILLDEKKTWELVKNSKLKKK